MKIGEKEAQRRAQREALLKPRVSPPAIGAARAPPARRAVPTPSAPPAASVPLVEPVAEREPDTSAKMISTRNRLAYNAYQKAYQKKRRERMRAVKP